MPRSAAAREAESQTGLPTLVFLRRRTCGHSRRMEALVAWTRVTKHRQLRVVDVDADERPEVCEALGVSKVPALVLVKDGAVVGRLEGRAHGRQIEGLIGEHIEAVRSSSPGRGARKTQN